MLALILLPALADGPAPEDVKAGWVALIIFLLLAVAVAVLGWSLTKHLRKAQAAKDAGAYGDEQVATSDPVEDDSSAPDAPTQSP